MIPDDLPFYLQHLAKNLSSPIDGIRRVSFSILNCQVSGSQSSQLTKIFNLLSVIQEIPVNSIDFKQVNFRLLNLQPTLHGEQLTEESICICTHYLLGREKNFENFLFGLILPIRITIY